MEVARNLMYSKKRMKYTLEDFHKVWVEAGKPIAEPWSTIFVNINCQSFHCRTCPMREYCDRLVGYYRELYAVAASTSLETSHAVEQVSPNIPT